MFLLNKFRFNIYFISTVFVANILTFVTGWATAWTSPVLVKLNDLGSDNPLHRALTENEAAWISSLLFLGSIAGPFLTGYVAGRYGRRITLLLLGFPHLIAFCILAVAETLWLYYLARLLNGISAGGCCSIICVYCAELAEDSYRGACAGLPNVAMNFGVLVAYSLGPYVSLQTFNLTTVALMAVFIILFGLFAPETPVHLLAIGEYEKGMDVLQRLRGTNVNVTSEFDSINKTLLQSDSDKSIRELFRIHSNRKALLIILCIDIFMQLTGVYIILLYNESIFKAAHSSIPAAISTIIVGAVSFIASFFLPLLIDRCGRKILLIVGGIGTCITTTTLGAYFYLQDYLNKNLDAIYWLPLVCLVAFLALYTLSFGPVPWVLSAEIFPSNVREWGLIITGSFVWFVGYIILQVFPILTNYIGIYGTFWVFGVSNLLAMLYAIFYVPETKGLSSLEIKQKLEKM